MASIPSQTLPAAQPHRAGKLKKISLIPFVAILYAYCAAGPEYPRIPHDLIDEMEQLRGLDEPHIEARVKQLGSRRREGNAVYNYLKELVAADM